MHLNAISILAKKRAAVVADLEARVKDIAFRALLLDQEQIGGTSHFRDDLGAGLMTDLQDVRAVVGEAVPAEPPVAEPPHLG